MRKLSNIQVLRGVAALLVVVFHARGELDGLGIRTRLPDLLGGAFGVDLFFVVSGLVMVHASAPLFGAARSALPFMGKRLARIVPLYWAVTALFVLLDPTDARGTLGRRAFGQFVALSLFFVPYVAPANDDAWPVYSLGWTLDYEMAFYLCFALVLALPRRAGVAALAGGLGALVALNLLVTLPGWLAYLGATQILEFVAGLLVGELVLSGRRLPRAAALALALAGIAAVLAATPYSDVWWGTWRGVVWGLPAAAVVGAAALCSPDGRAGPLRRGLERLGDASYALYLVHYGLYIAVEAALGRVADTSRLPAGPVMLLLVTLAVAAGFVVHRIFEVPVTRWLQRRVAPRRPPSLAVAEP
ncbi:acyltransferase family protein [Lichenibacterium dinghuense]|uniref:acyltransferase family protein n=1 Tax=Lichenibacterium dinghuense TaxID=2895977 RepID=UPI001F3AD729|nr:acyltransferase [Lichenibacterium sp. 6Y81]